MKSREDAGWQELGYRVIRRENASGKDPKTGQPTFTRDQVEEASRFDGRAPGRS